MVELESDTRGTGHSSEEGYAGSLLGRGGHNRCRDLTKECLEVIFAEDDPHVQFKLFVSRLWMTSPASMTTSVRIIAEYDFHNVVFCREQHFTTEQTIAFRGIALSVFETDVVNGKLSLGEAFEAFTHQVLALAGAEDTGTNTTAATIKTANCSSDPLPCGDVASASKSEQTIGGGGSGDRASATGDGGGSTRVEDGDSSGSVFSVGDVDAITRFVARGLYRNFTLYRMCFQHEEKCCREMRQVQVETPLDLPPLNEAAEPDV